MSVYKKIFCLNNNHWRLSVYFINLLCSCLSHLNVFVHHFLFVDEMRGLLDERHEVGDVVRPIVESVVYRLVLVEVHDPAQTVRFSLDCA